MEHKQAHSKTDLQQNYVRDSLMRAFKELKEAKINGRTLQNVDDFISEMNLPNARDLFK